MRGGGGEKDCAGAECGLAVGGRAVSGWACGINARRGNRRRSGKMKKPRRVRGLLRFCKCASYFLAVFLAGAGLAASCAFWAASSSDSCLPS